MLFPWLTLFDLNTVRANFKKPIDLKTIKSRSDDFALLVPIFNNLKYLTNLEFLKKYSKHVILCTTTNESEEFYKSLWEMHEKYGFRVTLSQVGGGGKNPWIIYNKTLLAHDAVLKESINVLTEKYVIFIDGDTFVDGELETLVGAMDEKGYDITSVRILPTKRDNIIEKLQGIEYDVAMQARLIYPWLTSGAGMVAKRSVMIEIMKNHSLFFNGGDIEIGKLADMMGYKVGHLPMNFYTDIPSTVGTWIKQRFSWMCGCFRHSIINLDHNLKHPFHFLYYTYIIYFLWPFKMVEMFRHLYLLPTILGIYVVFTYLANWKVRNSWMLIFPLYALFQVLVITWFGIYKYLSTVVKSGNIGRIKLKHNPLNVSVFNPKYTLKYLSNYSVAFSSIFLVSLLLSSTVQKRVLGREYEATEMAQLAIDSTQNYISEAVKGEPLTSNNSVAQAHQNVAEANPTLQTADQAEVAGAATVRPDTQDGELEIANYSGQNLKQIATEALYLYSAENGLNLDDQKVEIVADKLAKDRNLVAAKKDNKIVVSQNLLAKYVQQT